MSKEKIIQIDVEGIMVVALTNLGNLWVRKQGPEGGTWLKLELPDMEQEWIEPGKPTKKKKR